MVESLVDLYRITEMRNGTIYRTEFVGRVWATSDEVPPDGYQYVALSTAWQMANPGQQTIRLRQVG